MVRLLSTRSLNVIVVLLFIVTRLSIVRCQSPMETTLPTEQESDDGKSLSRIIPPLIVIVVVIGAVGGCFWYWRRQRQRVFVEAVMNDGQGQYDERI